MQFLEGKIVRGALIIMGATLFVITAASYWQFRTEDIGSPSVSPPLSVQKVVAGPDATTNKLKQQSSSDDISAIEADLLSSDLSALDKELDQINSQLSFP